VADKVVQAALKLVLEPIFEAGFPPVSYGFRPMRRAHDAIAEIHPVALQVLFGVNELAIHHDDVALAAGHRYLPPPETLAVLQFMWQRQHGRDIMSWPDILQEAGRRL
jgi:hypothetical protein